MFTFDWNVVGVSSVEGEEGRDGKQGRRLSGSMMMLSLTGQRSHKTAIKATLLRHRRLKESRGLVKEGRGGDTKNTGGIDRCITAAAETLWQRATAFPSIE